MKIKDFIAELKKWKFAKYKAINFAIGISGMLIYVFFGRLIYRPYIYNNDINDFHFADTFGNTFGTLSIIFLLVAILSNDTTIGKYLIMLGTFSVVLFELVLPLLGYPIDIWDLMATIITGFISYLIYNRIFKGEQYKRKRTNR